jgi:hypothetical protein
MVTVGSITVLTKAEAKKKTGLIDDIDTDLRKAMAYFG